MISLSSYLALAPVRAAWKANFPRTRSYVTSTNKNLKWNLVIPPSSWVAQGQRYGCLGTAYDYVVAVIWAGQSLDSPLERASKVISHWPELRKRFEILCQLLNAELDILQSGRHERDNSDFYRALGALADLDAISRAPVSLPAWIQRNRISNLKGLQATLRRNYPSEFVNELKNLLKPTIEDLPKTKSLVYNPVFGSRKTWLPLAADGDFILDDLLLELKVSVQRFRGIYVWQLLAYAALDRFNGQHRIKKVGIYNPRYRAFWSAPLNDVIQYIGGKNLGRFCEWFKNTIGPDNGPRVFNEVQNNLLKKRLKIK